MMDKTTFVLEHYKESVFNFEHSPRYCDDIESPSVFVSVPIEILGKSAPDKIKVTIEPLK